MRSFRAVSYAARSGPTPLRSRGASRSRCLHAALYALPGRCTSHNGCHRAACCDESSEPVCRLAKECSQVWLELACTCCLPLFDNVVVGYRFPFALSTTFLILNPLS